MEIIVLDDKVHMEVRGPLIILVAGDGQRVALSVNAQLTLVEYFEDLVESLIEG